MCHIKSLIFENSVETILISATYILIQTIKQPAGDMMKFGFPFAGSITVLSWSLLSYTSAYELTGIDTGSYLSPDNLIYKLTGISTGSYLSSDILIDR